MYISHDVSYYFQNKYIDVSYMCRIWYMYRICIVSDIYVSYVCIIDSDINLINNYIKLIKILR